MRLTFDEPEPGFTVIKLKHTDVPEEDRFALFIIQFALKSTLAFTIEFEFGLVLFLA